MLASGADGIKEAIQGFDDAYVLPALVLAKLTCDSRKSDIENERLPPDIIDVGSFPDLDVVFPTLSLLSNPRIRRWTPLPRRPCSTI